MNLLGKVEFFVNRVVRVTHAHLNLFIEAHLDIIIVLRSEGCGKKR